MSANGNKREAAQQKEQHLGSLSGLEKKLAFALTLVAVSTCASISHSQELTGQMFLELAQKHPVVQRFFGTATLPVQDAGDFLFIGPSVSDKPEANGNFLAVTKKYGPSFPSSEEVYGLGPMVGNAFTKLGLLGQFKCEVVTCQTSWWPPTFVPMGQKVYIDKATAPAGALTNATFSGQTESGMLPPECRITGDDCWKEAVKNGTIKFIATDARNPNQPTRPIVFSLYRTVDALFFPGQNKVLYCSKPFFADDGTLVITNDVVENSCYTTELEYSVGNSLGVIIKQKSPPAGVSACLQTKYDTQFNNWGSVRDLCP